MCLFLIAPPVMIVFTCLSAQTSYLSRISGCCRDDADVRCLCRVQEVSGGPGALWLCLTGVKLSSAGPSTLH